MLTKNHFAFGILEDGKPHFSESCIFATRQQAENEIASLTDEGRQDVERYAVIELTYSTGDEPSGRLPAGTPVTLNMYLPHDIWGNVPKDGWVIENIDEPREMKYRIRHPNGSLLDVLPEFVQRVNRSENP